MVKFLKNNKWLIIILFLATFLRVYRINYVELFGDELDAGYHAYSLMTTGKDYKGHLLPTYAQSFSEWRAPGLMYAMVPFIKVFGLNEWGVRLTAAFFGIALIIVWSWLLKTISVDKKVNLLSCLLLAIVPWQVQYSRAGYELTMMSTFLVLGIIFWVKALRSKKNWLILGAGVCNVVALYTYNTANLYVPLLVLAGLMVFGWQWKKIFKLFLVGFVLALPLIINILWGKAADRFSLFSVWNNKEVAAKVNDLRNEDGNSTISKVFYNKFSISIKKIFFNYTNALGSNFLFNEGDVTFRQSLHYVGNLFWVMLPLIVFGLYKAFSFKKKVELSDKFILLITLLAPIPSSLTIDGYNHASRLFLLSIPLTYWAAKGWASLNKKLYWIAFFIVALEFSNYQFYYWHNYRLESWKWWHTGYKELMSDIQTERQDYQRVLIDNVYEPSLIRYLFWNKVDPRSIYGLVDQMDTKVDGYYNGFHLENNVYFVDFKGPIKPELLVKGTLYAFSQEINVVGDRDLNVNPPDGIKILKTVRNYNGTPIFYLVTKS